MAAPESNPLPDSATPSPPTDQPAPTPDASLSDTPPTEVATAELDTVTPPPTTTNDDVVLGVTESPTPDLPPTTDTPQAVEPTPTAAPAITEPAGTSTPTTDLPTPTASQTETASPTATSAEMAIPTIVPDDEFDPGPTFTPEAASETMTPESPSPVAAALPGDVIINEVAWAGTGFDGADQWIELYNATSAPVSLAEWRLVAADGIPDIPLAGIIAPGGYYLLECNDDLTISDVPADVIYLGTMGPSGETLRLLDSGGAVIDTANGDGGEWPAGQRQPPGSMERIAVDGPDNDTGWTSNNPLIRNGTDSRGDPVNGTPRQPNSTTYPALPGEVVINEVAWGGSQADAAAEWIELVNTTGRAIDLTGWRLAAKDGSPDIRLAGIIQPRHGYFLIERDLDQVVNDVPADLVASFAGELADGGETLYLSIGELVIDTANADGGTWPAGQSAPKPRSMERVTPSTPDGQASWVTNDAFHRNGSDAAGNPINGTPRRQNSSLQTPRLLIGEVLYDGLTAGTEGDEFIELCNAQPDTALLRGIKVGDAAFAGSSESMFALPDNLTIAADDCLVIAKNAAQFVARFGFWPDFELVAGLADYPDTAEVPQLMPYPGWAGNRWALSSSGDEVVVLDADDAIIDSVAFAGGDYNVVGLAPDPVHAVQPDSLQRLWPLDTDSMPADFVRRAPSPGTVTRLPAPLPNPPPAPEAADGMYVYRGILNSHSSYSDASVPPVLAYAVARASGLDFLAVTDNGAAFNSRTRAGCVGQAERATEAGHFVAMCGYEYRGLPHGFVTVWNTPDVASHLDPDFDTLAELRTWLLDRPGAVTGLHSPFRTSPVKDLPPEAGIAPLMHLWQTQTGTSIRAGSVDPLETAWVQVLGNGWQLAPLAAGSAVGEAVDSWGLLSAARTGIVAAALNHSDVIDAIRSRRVFATQDESLALTLRAGQEWMGSRIEIAGETEFTVTAFDLDPQPEPLELTLFDRTLPLMSTALHTSRMEWRVPTAVESGHYYWVRAVQADGDVAQTAPLWVAGRAPPSPVVINEILPAPHATDWNGDGSINPDDEWLELYNPGITSVGLGGWQIGDASGDIHIIPLLTTIPAGGFAVVSGDQTGLGLNNSVDHIYLQRPDTSMADTYQYDQGPGYDVSLCRLPDGGTSWRRRCLPTPLSANLELPGTEPTRTDILGARRLPSGSWIKLRGHITVPPGIFSTRVAYLQDGSAGIRLYLPADHRLWCEPGQRVEVIGHTGSYYGELQLRISDRHDMARQETGEIPQALPVTSGQMVEPYEGHLVLLSGTVTEIESGSAFWIDDGTGPARVYVDPDTPIGHIDLTVGQSVQVVGVVSQRRSDATERNDGYRLLPRYTQDILAQDLDIPMLVPLRLPETGGRPD